MIWSLRLHWSNLEFLIFIPEVKNILQSQEGFLMNDQTYLSQILRYREVLDIKYYVLFERNPLLGSTPLKNLIHGVRNILQELGSHHKDDLTYLNLLRNIVVFYIKLYVLLESNLFVGSTLLNLKNVATDPKLYIIF